MKIVIILVIFCLSNIEVFGQQSLDLQKVIEQMSEITTLKKLFTYQRFNHQDAFVIFENKLLKPFKLKFKNDLIKLWDEGYIHSYNAQYFFQFEDVKISKNIIYIKFVTTSIYLSEQNKHLKNKYIRGDFRFKKKKGLWVLIKQKIVPESCCKFYVGYDDFSDN